MTTKEKAALKIAKGTYQCVSGGLIIVGHSFWCALVRSRPTQLMLARHMIQSGEKSFKDGMAEWNK